MRAVNALRLSLASVVFVAIVCACTMGPPYRRPDTTAIVPAEWHWKLASPSDAIPKGEWWKVFNDPVLESLETQALAASPGLRSAVARVDEARALARLTRSQFFPEISLDPAARRERTSGNLPTPIPFKVPSATFNTFSIPLDLSYEIDLWGRVRRSFEAAQAEAQASVADYENILLTLTADIAVNYFLVRALDAEIETLRQTLESREATLRILNERFSAGVLLGSDVEQANTALATTKADLADVIRQRTETLHALAVLCGASASTFRIPEQPLIGVPVIVPAELPSTLLERRPDIARAERNLIARNAQIGVARAAYFPSLHLTAQGGFLSKEAGSLLTADSRVWSIAPTIRIPLFTAGRISADVKRAQAAYEEAVADYRQSIIVAFREVEDSLAQITLRDRQSQAQSDAVESARHVVVLAKARYDAGTVNYLEVADAQRNVLQQERRQAQLRGQRFAASVRLIKALGGGW